MDSIIYSIIIAIYNRPQELKELLESLTQIPEKSLFEVLVIEDGSSETCEGIVNDFASELTLSYFFKENTGQGFSRNFGAEHAKGSYLIFFDSDCLIPSHYFREVELRREKGDLSFWGGPDAAHPNFSVLQKSISFTMTSVLTTGGIRGSSRKAFQPRSFNMGIDRQIFLEQGGFHQTNLGEDVELSTRLRNAGIRGELIALAYVYHKRRNTPLSFFRQTFSFGKGRVLTGVKNKGGIKLTHGFPTFFILGLLSCAFVFWVHPYLAYLMWSVYGFYFLLLFLGATRKERDIRVGFTSIFTLIIQFSGYGMGFLREWVNKRLLRR